MAEEPSADCWIVQTQEDLDEALAERATDPTVCIHVRGDAEQAVKDWGQATRTEQKPAGNW